MNATQQQRAMDAFADDCEITSLYFGLVENIVQFEYDDEGNVCETGSLDDEGFSEIVQGPTCAIGALIVDLWKSGDLTGESVKAVMLYMNDTGYCDLPPEVQDTLQKVYGLDKNHFNELQSVNDLVYQTSDIRFNIRGEDNLNDIYDGHINIRESLVISTLINFEEVE